MSNLRDIFVRIYPFATELLLQLDIWDTAALSLACRDVYNHIRQHPTAFSKVDLRDPAAIAALSRVVEDDRHHLQNLRHTLRDFLTRVHYYCFPTDRHLLPFERDSVGPPRAFQSLVVERHVNVRTMVLDGTHVTKEMLSEVLRIMSPTLEVLSLVFTYGCRFDELVDMFNEELQLEKLRELKVWGMGQARSWGGIANPSTWLGWSDELLVRLKTAVEPQGVRLDTTFCSVDDHPGCRISLYVPRQCGICGQGGFEIQCNYVEGFPSRRVCRSESICTVCYSFYCRNCVTSNLALVSGATKVCQMCPKCEEFDSKLECSGCGAGSHFTRAPDSGLRSLKNREALDKGDLQPCHICEKWYCDECTQGTDLSCDNCWHHACTTCIIGQYMASNKWSLAFVEKAYSVYDRGSKSFMSDLVIKRLMDLKKQLTGDAGGPLSDVAPSRRSTPAVKPNPDIDSKILDLILTRCETCYQQYLCPDCQVDPECDWPYQRRADAVCPECSRPILFWESGSELTSEDDDSSDSEDEYWEFDYEESDSDSSD
ncbi:hypothetical protein K440DRAFT_664578 [Wilcoxina mikolae CBS 423.85]|nr:hypothetical protein K440DRAFT_664578 [Wilcoxina mikolae CBS 423.85]